MMVLHRQPQERPTAPKSIRKAPMSLTPPTRWKRRATWRCTRRTTRKRCCTIRLPSSWVPTMRFCTAIGRWPFSSCSNSTMRTKTPNERSNCVPIGPRFVESVVIYSNLYIVIFLQAYYRKAEVQAAAEQYDISLMSYGRALQLQPTDSSILTAAKRVAALSARQGECQFMFDGKYYIWAKTTIILTIIQMKSDCLGLELEWALCWAWWSSSPISCSPKCRRWRWANKIILEINKIIIIINYKILISFQHPSLMVLLVMVVSGIGYAVACAVRYYTRLSKRGMLDAPLDILADFKKDDDNQTSTEEELISNRNRYSKAQARQRFRKGKS